MTLPTFLGIGVPKGGTSWLQDLLASHPEVYIPTNTKGLRYFNVHFDRGPQWYSSFFPSDAADTPFKEFGEITAHYLYCEECPQRIESELDRPKLILMLRNPVDRTWSHYKHTARLKNYQGSFTSFLEEHPAAIRYSHYTQHIKRYLGYFDQDQILTLLFDQVFADIESARSQIAEFLAIDPQTFPENAGRKVVNRGFIPRYRTLYALVAKTNWLARDNHLHWPGHLAKKIGLKRLISVPGEQPQKMSDANRQELQAYFEPEIGVLERILQTDLSAWRAGA